MIDPASVPEAALDPKASVGAAAVAQYIEGREFGSDRRLPTEYERDLIQDAIEGFIAHEQWLPFEHDEVELLARLRHAASVNQGEASDLCGCAADALSEFSQRLALQRHTHAIMTEGLLLQSEALKQAHLGGERAAWRSKSSAPFIGGVEVKRPVGAAALAPPSGANERRRSLYRVKFWRRSVTADRMSIEVAAEGVEAARARVAAWGAGQIELTPREEGSEALEREELQASSFERLLDADEPNAVMLIGSAEL